MPQIERLKLYSVFLPKLMDRELVEPILQQNDPDDRDDFNAAIDALRYGTVFDCRQLPIDFVYDSGDGYKLKNNWLPYPECYFEMADGNGIVAWQEYEPDPLRRNLPPINLTFVDDQDYGDGNHEIRFPPFAGLIGILDVETEHEENPYLDEDDWIDAPLELMRRAAILFKGIICLLTEQLVLDQVQPDRMPHLNKARQKKGKLPLDGERHVLTLYVPAIRYAVSRSAKLGGGTHAPPCLHWRRGHERMLGRGTNLERAVSVRRHLVGDPDRGFIKPTYRLVARKAALERQG